MATMRHGNRFEARGWKLRLDTRDSQWYVLRDEATQEPIARQSRQDAGRRYRQGTNPDREGYLAYSLEWVRPYSNPDKEMSPYDDCARRGDLVSPTFLDRLAEAYGHKRPQ